jgi:DNA-binding NtrC family response regulator
LCDVARILLVDLSDGQALGIAAELESAGVSVLVETSIRHLGRALAHNIKAVVVAHRADDSTDEGVRIALEQTRPDLPLLTVTLSSRPSRAALTDLAHRIRREVFQFDGAVLIPLVERAERFAGLLIGASEPMKDVFERIDQVAPTSVSVLIQGESGTGKELVAQALHLRSSRRNGPLIRVNCAALPAALLESELFGHQRGAFTGAIHDRAGRFEAAAGGTLFLDEIDSAEPAVQGKLLRAIEAKEFERLGESRTRKVDVRIVAATNADLEELAEKRRFRPDLLYRLAAVDVRLPPLRTRADDLVLLIADAVQRLNEEVGRHVQAIRGAAVNRLAGRLWPGNVRELNNVLCRSILACRGEILEVEHLPPESVGRDHRRWIEHEEANGELREAIESFVSGIDNDLYRRVIDETERQLFELVLREQKGNIRRASHVLGIARNTLKERIRRFDLSRKDDS